LLLFVHSDRHKITRKWNYEEVKTWYTNLYTRLCNTVEERKRAAAVGNVAKNSGDTTPSQPRSNMIRSETPSTLVRAMAAMVSGSGKNSP
jgi:hypothetical protein